MITAPKPTAPAAEPLQARLFLSAAADTSGKFQYMPGGRHEITCTQKGKPVTVVVEVNAKTADTLNAQLASVSRRLAPQKPYCDFNHDKDKASFWPQSFAWENGGVVVSGEFSASGKAAIEGKDYRGFSPTFFVDDTRANPAQVICNESAGLNFGGLVNEPAFRAIEPLFAKSEEKSAAGISAAVSTATQQKDKHMTETASPAVAAKAATDDTALNARIATLEADKNRLEAADKARREKDAKAAVSAAVKDGRIPAQNTEIQAKWEARLTADPADLALLEAMTPAAALTAKHTTGTAGVQVSQEDPRNVLALYARTRDARSRGELYAKEIAPLLAKGAGLVGLDAVRPRNDSPLEATNSFGTLVGNIISQRVLELLRFQLPALQRISTDFSDQQVKYSQAVYTRYIGIPTVGTYSTSTGYPAIDTAAATDVSVTINQHKCVELDLNAEQLSGTARRLFDEQVPAMSYALAKDLIDYAYALITVANYTNTPVTETAQNFGRPTIVDLAKALTDAGVPIGSQFRTLLLNTSYFAALQKDASIIQLAAFQDRQIIQENQLPAIGGFTVLEAPNLPTTGNMAGFGFSKSAIMVATRLPIDYTQILPGASFGQVQTVSDPDTGAAMMQVAYVNHTLGTANFRLAWMYGAAKAQVAAGTILKSS